MAQFTDTYLAPSPVVPGALLITAISRAYPMVVTFTDSIYNTYVVGQLIHLNIPQEYGMFQANQLNVPILSILSNTFSVDVDSRGFDAFVVPNPFALPPPSEPASLAPGGCRNIYNTQVEPFHSLDGSTGN